jgi:ribonuclease HII
MSIESYYIGCDEAGRGAWAGPIVAAAVLAIEKRITGDIRDSKELSETEREDLFIYLTKNFTYGIGVVSSQMIDTFGISYANKLAFERALRHLKRKCLIPPKTSIKIDGRPLPIKAIWVKEIEFYEKGESKFRNIAAASIIAKHFRDSILKERALKEPEWAWDRHKGYGTALHQNILRWRGPIANFHRLSYKPVKNLLK